MDLYTNRGHLHLLGLDLDTIQQLGDDWWAAQLDPIFSFDPSTCTIVCIQLNLVAGTLAMCSHNRPDLRSLVSKVLNFDVLYAPYPIPHSRFWVSFYFQWPFLPHRARPRFRRPQLGDHRDPAPRWRIRSPHSTPRRCKVSWDQGLNFIRLISSLGLCLQRLRVVYPASLSSLRV